LAQRLRGRGGLSGPGAWVGPRPGPAAGPGLASSHERSASWLEGGRRGARRVVGPSSRGHVDAGARGGPGPRRGVRRRRRPWALPPSQPLASDRSRPGGRENIFEGFEGTLGGESDRIGDRAGAPGPRLGGGGGENLFGRSLPVCPKCHFWPFASCALESSTPEALPGKKGAGMGIPAERQVAPGRRGSAPGGGGTGEGQHVARGCRSRTPWPGTSLAGCAGVADENFHEGSPRGFGPMAGTSTARPTTRVAGYARPGREWVRRRSRTSPGTRGRLVARHAHDWQPVPCPGGVRGR
jgi:hypothetical protein